MDLKQQISKLTSQMDMMARKKDEIDHTAKILTKSIKQNEIAVERLRSVLAYACYMFQPILALKSLNGADVYQLLISKILYYLGKL